MDFSINIGVTGHRNILASQIDDVKKAFLGLVTKLNKRYPSLNVNVFSALAEGADQIIFEEALKLRDVGIHVTPIVVLPMDMEVYQKQFSNAGLETFQKLYDRCIKLSLPVVQLQGKESPEQSYSLLGEYLVNKSDILLSVWDGEINGKLGGTSDVTERFLKPILHMRARDENLSEAQETFLNNQLHSSESRFVFHIKVARASGLNDKEISPVSHHYLVSQNGVKIEHSDDIPKTALDCFKQLSQLSEDCHIYSCQKQQHYSLFPDEGAYSSPDLKKLNKAFGAIDCLANRLQEQVKRIHIAIVVLTVLIASSFLIYAKLFPHRGVLIAYLCIFIIGFAWYKWVKPNEKKFKYALYRTISESLRIETFWLASATIDSAGKQSLCNHLVGHGTNEVNCVVSILRQSSLLGVNNQPDKLGISREQVIKDWIDDQRQYYKKAKLRLEKRHKLNSALANMCLYVPLGLLILLLSNPIYYFVQDTALLNVSLKAFVIFLAGLLPLIAAVIELYDDSESIKEQIFQYAVYERYLANVMNLNEHSDEALNFNTIIRTVGLELSREHIHWMITTKQKYINPAHGG